ncbi:MAG: hypothetical protein GXY15_01450 [Candidatus Hydrogenedentes bacterium]|mgnify:CR=1 FL=1|nr:hypothetical protein [Candidatus Hydrogenedentota bacterium]
MTRKDGKNVGGPAARFRLHADTAGLLAVLAVAAALRAPGLFRGLWADELYTLRTASLPWRGVLAQTVSPVIFWMTKAVLGVFPEPLAVRFPSLLPPQYESVPLHAPEWALRAPFLLAGLLTVAGVFLLLRRRAETTAALFAGMFLAVSPLHAYHSVEIRYYGLVCLAGALLLGGVLALEAGRTRRGAALAAAGLLLGMLTHLSFALAAVATVGGYGLFALLHTRPRAVLLRRLGGAGLVCAAAAGVFLAVVAGGSPGHFDRLRGLVAPSAAHPAADAEDAGEDPVDGGSGREKHVLSARNYLVNYLAARFLSCNGVAAALVVAPLLLLGLAAAFRRHRLLFFLLAANLLTAVPFFLLPVGHFWAPRYFIFQTVAAALLFGLGADAAVRGLAALAARTLPGLRPAAPVILLALWLAACPGPLRAGWAENAQSHNDWGARRIAEALATQVEPAMDKIVYCKPHKGRFSYLLIPHYLGRLVPDWTTAGSAGKESFCTNGGDFESLFAAFQGDPFWIVSFNGNNADPALNDHIAERGGKLHTDLGVASLWTMGDLPQAGPGPWKPPATETEAVLPEEARVEEVTGPGGPRKRYSVTLVLNDAEKPRTPTLFFPVCTAVNVDECALERGARHVVRFRLRAKDLRPVGNPKRTFRVMLEGQGSLTDLMYATGSSDWREYTLVFIPGADAPDGLVNPRIGFGNRGGTGAFEIEDFSCAVE